MRLVRRWSCKFFCYFPRPHLETFLRILKTLLLCAKTRVHDIRINDRFSAVVNNFLLYCRIMGTVCWLYTAVTHSTSLLQQENMAFCCKLFSSSSIHTKCHLWKWLFSSHCQQHWTSWGGGGGRRGGTAKDVQQQMYGVRISAVIWTILIYVIYGHYQPDQAIRLGYDYPSS